jgi:hypothetical protein
MHALAVKINSTAIWVYLSDGRELKVPLAWFPKLMHASLKQLKNFRLIGKGSGIHWIDLDEDISIQGLLKAR